jgi:hypothetical protein
VLWANAETILRQPADLGPSSKQSQALTGLAVCCHRIELALIPMVETNDRFSSKERPNPGP